MNRLVAFLSDFGTSNAYVSAVKAVILSRAPGAAVVDITHDVPAYDIRYGMFELASVYRFFPAGTIFVCVVDPGVGTSRRLVLMQTRTHIFLAPDNGLLSGVARQERYRLYELNRPSYFLPGAHNTFHARDRLAPVAAALLRGKSPSSVGSATAQDLVTTWPQATAHSGRAIGEVLVVDHFGNLITNIDRALLSSVQISSRSGRVRVGRHLIRRWARTYADAPAGRPAAVFGSHGFLEIAVHEGHASRALKARAGTKVEVRA